DDKGWDARKRAYCLKIQPATGSFARNLIYSTKPGVISTSCRANISRKQSNQRGAGECNFLHHNSVKFIIYPEEYLSEAQIQPEYINVKK
ncbi:hypothetical protein K8D16_23560, partial [Citrobacter freundii]|uniref:hypothetical protein n=1 Tax=Citrobacter freundii TaxID=546 RepID=UPI00207CBEE4